jgi:hypothetical protein
MPPIKADFGARDGFASHYRVPQADVTHDGVALDPGGGLRDRKLIARPGRSS